MYSNSTGNMKKIILLLLITTLYLNGQSSDFYFEPHSKYSVAVEIYYESEGWFEIGSYIFNFHDQNDFKAVGLSEFIISNTSYERISHLKHIQGKDISFKDPTEVVLSKIANKEVLYEEWLSNSTKSRRWCLFDRARVLIPFFASIN